MKIAVLMSSYNGESYIRQQIDSILAQEGGLSVELWVRDDGSTDSTRDILQEYAAQGMLSWYAGENLGPAKSFIDLILHCQGYDCYAFADQDDYWMPGKLSAAIAALSACAGPAMYFSNAELVGARLEPLHRNVYQTPPRLDFYTLSCAGGLLGCTMVFNRELARLIQAKQLPRELVMHDFYVAEVCALLEGSILYDHKPYVKYRQHSGNVVGVSHGVWQKIKGRLGTISRRGRVGIDDQAASIAALYGQEASQEHLAWLRRVSGYRRTALSRLRLAASTKMKFVNLNKAVTLRMAILLGNR